MAHVFKPVYTKPIPKAAERVRHKDGPAVRWKGRNNKWVVAIVCEDNPDRCRVEAARWYVEYTDHTGNPKRAKGYVDKGATESLMAELVRQSARISSGLLPVEAARPRRALSELIDRWRDYIEANGATALTADRTRTRCLDVCDGVKATRPSDLTPEAVQKWLAEKRVANRHKQGRFGKVTSNKYLASAKAFTRWLAVIDRSEPVDYLSAVAVRNDDTDPRYQRRPLSPDELDKLIDSTRRSAAVTFGLTGRERAALYLTASTTGLRAQELSSLTPESLDLTAQTVTIEARRAKNRRTDKLPLADDVAAELRAITKGRAGPVWPHRSPEKPAMAWWKRAAEMVARDLVAAGIPVSVSGRAFDFHALRGQFATDLDRAGVNMIRAQRLMRLSNPALLTKHYAKPDEAQVAEDVNKLRKGKTKQKGRG